MIRNKCLCIPEQLTFLFLTSLSSLFVILCYCAKYLVHVAFVDTGSLGFSSLYGLAGSSFL